MSLGYGNKGANSTVLYFLEKSSSEVNWISVSNLHRGLLVWIFLVRRGRKRGEKEVAAECKE